MTISLQLFSTSACHLCEQAKDLIQPLLTPSFELLELDISDSEQLMQRYALSIPVLRREDSGAELCWPFDENDVAKLLAVE